jgi:hypothetical protein
MVPKALMNRSLLHQVVVNVYTAQKKITAFHLGKTLPEE